ncbi:hypothetical protein QBC46DRAFT_416695 [Diplogelasinospora grovesii]|uniref:ABM domain-containing protein n=1 Tax=Diplogelasinospora grovesii TaxID=303347 RepID=A0AAN6NDR0_9PEZI|nr:hypothetical protein QBC46DRAFT_416695 [Diplogelasinospora grovesii]
MSGITERVIIPVAGGVEDWKEQLKFFLQSLKEQPGYLRTRWGPWSEDMQKLDLLIGWENAEACETWKESHGFAQAMSQFQPVMSGQATTYFVKFVPYAPKEVIGSPIVEVLTYANCTVPEDQMRATAEKAKALAGCNGVASGYSTGTSVNGGKVFVAVIGWNGMEASKNAVKMAYQESGQLEVHHVNFNFPIKGFRGL